MLWGFIYFILVFFTFVNLLELRLHIINLHAIIVMIQLLYYNIKYRLQKNFTVLEVILKQKPVR